MKNVRFLRAVGLIVVVGISVGTGQLPAEAASVAGGPARDAVIAGWDVVHRSVKYGGSTFVVPELSCGAEPAAVALGLGRASTSGEPETLAVVILRCTPGGPSYALTTLANGVIGDTDSNVSAGDHVTLEYLTTRRHLVMIAMDHDSGGVSSANGVRPRTRHLTYGAFPIFDGSALLPVPDFGQVTMSATLNGYQLRQRAATKLTRPSITTGRLLGRTFTLSYDA